MSSRLFTTLAVAAALMPSAAAAQIRYTPTPPPPPRPAFEAKSTHVVESMRKPVSSTPKHGEEEKAAPEGKATPEATVAAEGKGAHESKAGPEGKAAPEAKDTPEAKVALNAKGTAGKDSLKATIQRIDDDMRAAMQGARAAVDGRRGETRRSGGGEATSPARSYTGTARMPSSAPSAPRIQLRWRVGLSWPTAIDPDAPADRVTLTWR